MKKLLLLLFIFATIISGVVGTSRLASAALIHGFGAVTDDLSLTGGTVIDFEAQPLGSFTPAVVGDVTFSADGSSLITTNNPGFNATGKHLENQLSGFQSITFDFASSVSAFGFHFGASNEDWLLAAYDSGNALLESYTLDQTWYEDNGEYFGIQSAGIFSATLTQMTHVNDSSADHILLDDFTYQSESAAVPEPATVALLGIGLVGLAGAEVRRRRKKAVDKR